MSVDLILTITTLMIEATTSKTKWLLITTRVSKAPLRGCIWLIPILCTTPLMFTLSQPIQDPPRLIRTQARQPQTLELLHPARQAPPQLQAPLVKLRLLTRRQPVPPLLAQPLPPILQVRLRPRLRQTLAPVLILAEIAPLRENSGTSAMILGGEQSPVRAPVVNVVVKENKHVPIFQI